MYTGQSGKATTTTVLVWRVMGNEALTEEEKCGSLLKMKNSKTCEKSPKGTGERCENPFSWHNALCMTTNCRKSAATNSWQFAEWWRHRMVGGGWMKGSTAWSIGSANERSRVPWSFPVEDRVYQFGDIATVEARQSCQFYSWIVADDRAVILQFAASSPQTKFVGRLTNSLWGIQPGKNLGGRQILKRDYWVSSGFDAAVVRQWTDIRILVKRNFY